MDEQTKEMTGLRDYIAAVKRDIERWDNERRRLCG